MKNEIERKFLVEKPPPGLDNFPSDLIMQGYLLITEDREIRIRRKGDKYFQAVKLGAGLKRREIENKIGQLQFEDLWPQTEGRRIQKLRYEIDYQGNVIELDIYEGALKGLITAEVEFRSGEESARFTPPPWFGKEITYDDRYKNKNLALDGIPL